MYYYIYKTTNKITGKFYIGVHKTNCLADGYMGSGKVLQTAIKKYGVENFQKDIIEFFDDYSSALLKESEIVSATFLARPDVYNIRQGGLGGFDYINKHKLNSRAGYKFSDAQKRQISESRKLAVTDEHRKIISARTKERKPALGVKQKHPPKKTKEHKDKISHSLSGIEHKKVTCPHCRKVGGARAMKRWHFDNCGYSSEAERFVANE